MSVVVAPRPVLGSDGYVRDRGEALRELYRFVLGRLDDRVQLAEEAADALGGAFALISRQIVVELGRDITSRPWAHHELENFFLRSARRYRRHPDFKPGWDRGFLPPGP